LDISNFLSAVIYYWYNGLKEYIMCSTKRIFYGILLVIIALNLVNNALSDTTHPGNTIYNIEEWYYNYNS